MSKLEEREEQLDKILKESTRQDFEQQYPTRFSGATITEAKARAEAAGVDPNSYAKISDLRHRDPESGDVVVYYEETS